MVALVTLEEILCPGCGSAEPREILYGLADPELVRLAAAEGLSFAGCCVDEDSPLYRCRECSHEWGLAVRS